MKNLLFLTLLTYSYLGLSNPIYDYILQNRQDMYDQKQGQMYSIYRNYQFNLLERDEHGFTTIDYLVSDFERYKTVEVGDGDACLPFMCDQGASLFHGNIVKKSVKRTPCLKDIDVSKIDHRRAASVLFSMTNEERYSKLDRPLNCERVISFLKDDAPIEHKTASYYKNNNNPLAYLPLLFGEKGPNADVEKEIKNMQEMEFED